MTLPSNDELKSRCIQHIAKRLGTTYTLAERIYIVMTPHKRTRLEEFIYNLYLKPKKATER